MDTQLNINQVAKILNRSTKSIRNYIKDGKLKASKRNSKKGMQFFFNPKDVEKFAKEHLSISLAIDTMATIEKSGSEALVSNETSLQTAEMKPMEVQVFVETLMKVEKEKMDIVEEFSEYKAQLAYKVGQLEADLKRYEKSKKELDKIKEELLELQREYEIRDDDARQLLKMKQYYDNKRWWHFWKGSYKFNGTK